MRLITHDLLPLLVRTPKKAIPRLLIDAVPHLTLLALALPLKIVKGRARSMPHGDSYDFARRTLHSFCEFDERRVEDRESARGGARDPGWVRRTESGWLEDAVELVAKGGELNVGL